MKLLSYLVPGFLRKIDRYLLQNYPIVWETKVHYVLFYATILATPLLFLIGNVGIAVAHHQIPDFELMSFSIGWGLLFAFCAVGFYAYQQSFIRIKTYTLSQILLRLGLYLVAVTSIFANVLVLPTVVRNRVRQLYTFEEVKKDAQSLSRLGYLSSVLYETTRFGVGEDGKFQKKQAIRVLTESALNQQQEVEQMAKILNELTQIISPTHIQDLEQKREKLAEIRTKLDKINEVNKTDFTVESVLSREREIKNWDKDLPNEYRHLVEPEFNRITTEIKKQSWETHFKQSVLNFFNTYEFYGRVFNLSLKDFNDLRLSPSVTNVYLKIRAKYAQNQKVESRTMYADEYSSVERPYVAEDYELDHAIQNLIKFYLADDFLAIPNSFRYSNQYLENGRNISLEYSNKLNDVSPDKAITFLANPEHFQTSIEQQWKSVTQQANALPFANIILVFFTASMLLIVKLFTLRNLVISGVGMLVCLFGLVWFLFSEYEFMRILRNDIVFPVLSFISFDLIGWYGIRHSIFFLPSLIPILILIVMALAVAFVQWKQINRKWLQTFWVFLLSSALVTSGITYMILFYSNEPHLSVFGRLGSDSDSPTDIAIVYYMPYSYILLWMGILLTYWFYNRMVRLPAKK